jgi:esterase/lipase superfamily enzyme
MDVGLQDPLLATNRQLDQALTRLGIGHTFETYEGTHTSAVKARFESKVLPFFITHLANHQ